SLDVAERAGARAGVAHQHERRVLLIPALADIGAPRLLAHGMQVVRAHDRARLAITFRHRRLDPDPIGLFQRRCVRPVRLFRMARSAAGVENDRHGSSGTYLRIRDSRRKPHHCANVASDRGPQAWHPPPPDALAAGSRASNSPELSSLVAAHDGWGMATRSWDDRLVAYGGGGRHIAAGGGKSDGG